MGIEQQPARILLNKEGKGSVEQTNVDFSGRVTAFWWSPYDDMEQLALLHTVRLDKDASAPKRVVVDSTTKGAAPVDLKIIVFADVK